MNYDRKEVTSVYTIYYLNDKIHRTDGPATIYEDRTMEYYIDDVQYSKKEYYRIIKPPKCPEYMKFPNKNKRDNIT